MKTDAERLAELENMVINLVWQYTVFATYFEKKSEFFEARQSHPEFTFVMYDSLLCSFVVSARNVFKKGDEAESLPNFITHIGKTQHRSAIPKELKWKQRGMEQTFEKLTKLRNGAYAHRSDKEQPETLFIGSKVTLDMLKKVATLAKDILLELVNSERKSFLKSQMLSTGTIQALEYHTRLVLNTFRANS